MFYIYNERKATLTILWRDIVKIIKNIVCNYRFRIVANCPTLFITYC